MNSDLPLAALVTITIALAPWAIAGVLLGIYNYLKAWGNSDE